MKKASIIFLFMFAIILSTISIIYSIKQSEMVKNIEEQNIEFMNSVSEIYNKFIDYDELEMMDKSDINEIVDSIEIKYMREISIIKRDLLTLLLIEKESHTMKDEFIRLRALFNLENDKTIKQLELVKIQDYISYIPLEIYLPSGSEEQKYEDGIEFTINNLEDVTIGFSLGGKAFEEMKSLYRIIDYQNNNLDLEKRMKISFEPNFLKYNEYLCSIQEYSSSSSKFNNIIRDIFYVECENITIHVDINRPDTIDSNDLDRLEYIMTTIKEIKTETKR